MIRLSCSVAPWPGQLNRCALVLTTVLALITMVPNVALACSGPVVSDLVDANVHLSRQLFVLACLLVPATYAVYLFRRNRVRLLIVGLGAGILALHPVWTVSAAGDCGALKVMSSFKATGFLALIFLVQLTFWLLPLLRRRAHNKSLDASGFRLFPVRKT